MISASEILHFNFHTKQEILTSSYLPLKQPVKILITSGASCPDILVEKVIRKLAGWYGADVKVEGLIGEFDA